MTNVVVDSEKIEEGADKKLYLVRKITERTEISRAIIAQTKAQLDDTSATIAADKARMTTFSAEIDALRPLA